MLTTRNNNENWQYLTIVVLSLLLIAFNIVRIVNVSVTHDEALTYHNYVQNTYAGIVANVHGIANNHFLNSILSKISIDCFQDNLFFLRLPNLLAQIIYLVFSFLLCKRLFKNKYYILFSFALLQLNPFMFEFWGLCRGYGLSIAFMMGSIYFLLRYLDTHKIAALIFHYLLMMMAVYANLSLLNFALGCIAVISLHLLLQRNIKLIITTAIPLAVSAFIIYYLIATPIAVMKETGQLYYGGENNFIKDTIGSLLQDSLYLDDNGTVMFIIGILMFVLVAASGIYLLVKTIRQRAVHIPMGLVLCSLLFIPALSTIVQFHLLHNKYLIFRTALFFYPLFILYFVYALYRLTDNRIKLRRRLILIISILFVFNFVRNINFTHTRNWEFDRHTQWLMQRMVDAKQNKGEIKIYLDFLFSSSIKYYKNRLYPNKFGYIEGVNEMAYDRLEYDFYLIREWGIKKVPDSYILDTTFSNYQYYLYKRKQWDND